MNDDEEEQEEIESGSESEDEDEWVKPLHVLSRLCVADVVGARLATCDGVLGRAALQSAVDAAESTAAWTARAVDAALSELRGAHAPPLPSLLHGDALCRAAVDAAVRRHAATVSRDPRKLHCVAFLAFAWLAPALAHTRSALLSARTSHVLRLCCPQCCSCSTSEPEQVFPSPVVHAGGVLVMPAAAYLRALDTARERTRDAEELWLTQGAGTLWAALRRAVEAGLRTTLRQLDRTRLALTAADPVAAPVPTPVPADAFVARTEDEFCDFAEEGENPCVPAPPSPVVVVAEDDKDKENNKEDMEQDKDEEGLDEEEEEEEGTEAQRFVARFRAECAREPQRWTKRTLEVPEGYFDSTASLLGQHLTPEAVNSAPHRVSTTPRPAARRINEDDIDVSWWRPGRFIHERSLQPVTRADVRALCCAAADDDGEGDATRELRATLLEQRLAALGCTAPHETAFFRAWHEATAAVAPNAQCARAALPARLTALDTALRAPDVPPRVRTLFFPFLRFLFEDGHLSLDAYLRILVASSSSAGGDD